MMSTRWSKQAYHLGNTFLPIAELRRTLIALRNLFAGLIVSGATAAQGALRQSRQAAESLAEQQPFIAPDRRWIVRQWRAGIALIVIGALAAVSLWLTGSIIGKIAMIVLSVALIATGIVIAGAMSYLARKSVQSNLTVADWLRRPSLWI